MDILTHTLSGLAIGTVVAGFSGRGQNNRKKIVLASGFAGALPDLDAISLWSGFDSTIGEWFNLSHSGKEIYSATFWYSHHAFLHSLLAGFLLAGLLSFMIFLVGSRLRDFNINSFVSSVRKNRLMLLGFILGFSLHLLEDMPTPSSTWGGVNFFWPFSSYIGGTGNIWWWNNYDIFLIVLGVLMLNLILFAVKRVKDFDLRKFVTGVFVVGFTLALIQIYSRDYDFSYSGHTIRYQEFEKKSKEVQREIIGEKAFQWMEAFDKKLKIYF